MTKLMMATVNYQIPYSEGESCYRRGGFLTDCPYPSLSKNGIAWEAGFLNAESLDDDLHGEEPEQHD